MTSSAYAAEMLPVVMAFGLIFLVAMLLTIWSWLSNPKNITPLIIGGGLCAAVWLFGSAMLKSDFTWAGILADGAARFGAGIGKGMGKLAPWIGGAGIAGIIAWAAVKIAPQIPKDAFVPIVKILAAVSGLGAVTIWARPENLFAICGTIIVSGLIALVVYMNKAMERLQERQIDLLRDKMPRQIQQPRREEHRGKLIGKTSPPAKRNPWEKWE